MTTVNGNGAEYKKTNSRKWRLVLFILLIATLGTFIPPLLSAWLFKAAAPLFILTGGHFVTLVTLIVSAYFGANVWQKHVLKGQASVNISAGVTTETVTETKIEENEKGEA
jgi:O-antigen/teichoic acid export membrane protein